jgi:ligand-binding sensor domain-containing protein
MKIYYKYLIVLILVLLSTPFIFPQWVQTNGLYGGNINCFAISGTNLFAGTGGLDGGGIFLSTNNGTNWINAGLANISISSLAVSTTGTGGTNLFAGADGGVYLSTNNGTSWTAVNNGLTNPYVTALSVSGTNLFAGTSGYGIYLSTNNGTSWTAVNNGLTNSDVRAFAVSGTNLFAGTYGGVYLSTNNGTSWTAVNNGLTGTYSTYVNVLAVSGTNLFAGTYGGVFLSTNNGTSWTADTVGLTNSSVSSLAVNPTGTGSTNLFVGTSSGVYLSTNNGTNWINAGLANISISSLAVSITGTGGTNLFAGADGGVYLSTNNGTSWTAVDSGLTAIALSSFATFPNGVSGTNLYAGTNGGVFFSTNNGTSWTGMNMGFPANLSAFSLAVSPDNEKTGVTNLFAATWGDGVYLSTDNGNSWIAVNNGLLNTFVSSLAVFTNSVGVTNLFAGTSGGVYLSTNNGTSWSGINNGLSTDIGMYCIAISPAGTLFAERDLYEKSNYGVIFRSINDGSSWIAIDTLYTGGALEKFYFSTADVRTGKTNLLVVTFNGVFLSTDNGTNWTEVNSDWPNNYNVSSLVTSGENIFVGTEFLAYSDGVYYLSSGGVYLSTNNGTSWGNVSTGLPNPSIGSLLGTDGTNLFADANGIVWMRPLSEMITAVKYDQSNLPISYSMQQNYPNPFNPSTMINYSVPKSGLVTIKVYDILGREIATLVNGEKPTGNYNVEFNASRLSSGIYFYRMQAGNFVETKKLLLLK